MNSDLQDLQLYIGIYFSENILIPFSTQCVYANKTVILQFNIKMDFIFEMHLCSCVFVCGVNMKMKICFAGI